MLNKILNLNGKTLNKSEQKLINGGEIQFPIGCRTRADCIRVTGEFDWDCSRRIGGSGICVPL